MYKPVVYTFAVALFLLMGAQSVKALDSCVVPTTLRYNIDEHSQCREVTNNHPSGEDIMVPLKTAAEWVSGGSSFLQNLPTGIRAIQCGDCVIQSGDLAEVGRYKAGGGAPAAEIIDQPINVFVQGDYAYVASTLSDRFSVFDISDPTNPTFVSSITSTQLDNAHDVFVQGNYAYVTSVEGRAFIVINITNPASPSQVGFISNANYWNTRALHVSGNYAYVVTHNQDRFVIINITNPAAPSEVSSLTGAYLDGANGIDVVGNYAYIVNRNGNSMTILNVSNPASPSFVSELSNADLTNAQGINVVGDYAYVTSTNTGKALTVIDVSNPAAPSQVWTSTDTNGSDIVVKENYAFITRNGFHSVDAYDISNPLSPVKVDFYRDTVNMTNPDGLHIQGRYIYVPSQTNDSLNIIDIGCDPLAPTTGSSGDSAIALTSCEEWTPPALTVAYTDNAYNGSFHMSHTYTSMNIGAAASDRIVVVFAGQGSFSSATVSSMTIGGVPATIIGSGTGTNMAQTVAYANVPTGTTADVTVNWTNFISRAAISVYTITNAQDTSHFAFNNGGGGGAGSRSTTVTVPSNGIGLAHCIHADGGVVNWTNAAEDFENVYASHVHSGARNTTAGSQTMTASNCRNIIGISWQ